MPEVETRRVGRRGHDERVITEVRTDERVTVEVRDFGAILRATVRSAHRTRLADVHLTRDEARGLAEALRVINDVPTEEEARYRALAEQATVDFERARREWVEMKAERDEAREHEVRARTDAAVAERNVESLVLAVLGIGKAIGVLRDDLPGITGPEALRFANDIEGQATNLRAIAERLQVYRDEAASCWERHTPTLDEVLTGLPHEGGADVGVPSRPVQS